MASFADPDDPNLAEALWRLRLRGLAAADGIEAHRRSKEAREFLSSRTDPWLGVLHRFLTEDGPDGTPLWFRA